MERGKKEQHSVNDEKSANDQDLLKIQDFVKQLGGIERAKLALDELARLRKSA